MEFLGRKIRATEIGVEFEGDSKHVEKLAEEWGTQHCEVVAAVIERELKRSDGGRSP